MPETRQDSTSATRTVVLVLVLRVALAAAVTASAALLIEYQNPGDPSFCGYLSGCHQVRIAPQTRAFSELLMGVSLPQLGLVSYVALFAMSLLAKHRVYQVVLACMAVTGGLFAAYLLYVQKTEIGAFCQWCVTVDSAAIVAAIASALLVWWPSRAQSSDSVWSELAGSNRAMPFWVGTGVLAVALPFVWGAYVVVPPAPPDIAGMAEPAKVTIVQFTDFQCPFCRKLHPVLEDVRHKYGDKVAYVRLMKPLTMHPGALPAALAYLCAPEDKRDAMADALYKADDKQLTASGVARIAADVGVPPEAFAACVQSPETKALLDRDAGVYERIGPRGLPLTFVNARTIIGYDAGKVLKSVEIEAGGGRIGLPVWLMFVVLGACAVVASVVTVRSARRSA